MSDDQDQDKPAGVARGREMFAERRSSKAAHGKPLPFAQRPKRKRSNSLEGGRKLFADRHPAAPIENGDDAA